MLNLKNKELETALAGIKASLRELIGDSFRLFLYGSYARGEEKEFSDIDLMLVVPDELDNYKSTDNMRDVIYEFSISTDYLFSVMIVGETHFNDMQGFQVFLSVEKEGVLL